MTLRPQLPDRAPRAKGAPTALDGLLVVDFTRVVAGPACTQTLADFGAEVIKIENPDGGDDTRHYEHADLAGESAAFVSLNRNKRGIALDLTKPGAPIKWTYEPHPDPIAIADLNSDGLVDVADYNIWAANVGKTAATPEPISMIILAIGGGLVALKRRNG